MDTSIVFVGGGNMATSLISGLRNAGWAGEHIAVIEPDADKANTLTQQYGVATSATARTELLDVDALVLAVKPQMLRAVCEGLVEPLGRADPLIISIAAGVPLAGLRAWLGEQRAYVRCMPNTPSLIGAGATGLYADDAASASQCRLAEQIMQTAGVTVWVDEESKLDAVTATSGSGPAYFFAFMEAMQASAEKLGLSEDDARELVLHTALGAARMAIESNDDPATLRDKVTSPGGTTEAALGEFSRGALGALVEQAMHAAAHRADTLGRELLDK